MAFRKAQPVQSARPGFERSLPVFLFVTCQILDWAECTSVFRLERVYLSTALPASRVHEQSPLKNNLPVAVVCLCSTAVSGRR